MQETLVAIEEKLTALKASVEKFKALEGRVDRGEKYEEYKTVRQLTQDLKHLAQQYRNEVLEDFKKIQTTYKK